MNDYKVETRKRGQTLLIVEGCHEKNILFKLLFECFPEINIDIDNVWIYGTNIYMLYEDIVKEYGESWAEDDIDIDLPFVISRKQSPDSLKYKDDFTNILLVFDYERHDPNFSEYKILSMQRKLTDAADMGKLYINYPMIESYRHLKSLRDSDYKNRKIPVSLQPGSKYKELVSKETVIGNVVDFPHRINDLTEKEYDIKDNEVRNKCINEILNISSADNLLADIENIFFDVLDSATLKTLKHHLSNWIAKLGYAHKGKTYYQDLKDIFVSVIYHNISKANWIQNGQYEVEDNRYKNCFEYLDFGKILEMQNEFSKDNVKGYIWVINTCVFIVPDYNFALLQ